MTDNLQKLHVLTEKHSLKRIEQVFDRLLEDIHYYVPYDGHHRSQILSKLIEIKLIAEKAIINHYMEK